MKNTKIFKFGALSSLLFLTCFSVSCQENSEHYWFGGMIIKDNVIYAHIYKYENNQSINDLIVLYDLANNSRIGEIDPDDRIGIIERYLDNLFIVFFDIPIIQSHNISQAVDPIFTSQLNVNIDNYDTMNLYSFFPAFDKNNYKYSIFENNNLILSTFINDGTWFIGIPDYLFIDIMEPNNLNINFFINNYYYKDHDINLEEYSIL